MPRKRLSGSRKALLVKMESIIGNQCYNTNIQNWGPGGEFEGQGRDFRYPITLCSKDEAKNKRRRVDVRQFGDNLSDGYYAFGANELHIMRGLEQVLEYMEETYEVDLK